MFICNGCLGNYSNDPSPIKSAGRCESCGSSAVCNDIPSRNLYLRKDINDPNRPSRLGLLFQEPEPGAGKGLTKGGSLKMPPVRPSIRLGTT